MTLLAWSHPALADDDGLEPYRERFRLGMDRYKAGAMSEAVRVWGAIYEELGPHRGYRLAFDLGRAHDANGEATRAAERYASFLEEVSKRRAAGEAIPSLVEHEEEQAGERVRELNRTHGRIQVAPRFGTELAQVDDSDPRLGTFTAYVAPGRHVVSFGAGRADAEKVDVTVGLDEVVVARPTRVPDQASVTPSTVVIPPVLRTVRETEHPFSPTVLYAAMGVTAASIVAPAVGYAHAISVYDAYELTTTHAQRNSDKATYTSAQTTAYSLLALPIGFAALTAGLTAWYFAGAKQREVVVSFGVAPLPRGGGVSATGAF